MHLDTAFIRTRGKVYKRVLLRTSYREGKKVKHKTIANLSQQSEETIEAIRLALKNKQDIHKFLASIEDAPSLKKGPAIAAIYVLMHAAQQLGITNALGNSLEGKLALWQVLARVIAQGSRLSAVRLASTHATCDLMNLESFNEDDLYRNLDWLSDNQEKFEKKLFNEKTASGIGLNLFLYDVTSSYAEGDKNEYSSFGYNRDKKRGKKQIVVGLLAACDGDPVSIQVFEGNRADNTTFVEQVHKIRDKFGVENVIWVGDRGMIKNTQIAQLDKNFQYITAITKPQLLSLIEKKKIAIEDFSNELKEIIDNDTGMRYILRRNPVRVEEISAQRKAKLTSLEMQILKANQYLKEHPRARLETSLRKLRTYAKKLKINDWACIRKNGLVISMRVNEEALAIESRFDGCYAVKTNVIDPSDASAEIMHARYKDLSDVEWAFRTMKTTHLEIRPYYVQKCSRTDGHVFVVMLAYKLVRYLREVWKSLEVTVEEGVTELAGFHSVLRGDNPTCQYIPQPHGLSEKLLTALKISLPKVFPYKGINVATRKKLVKERQTSKN
jgi:transposase